MNPAGRKTGKKKNKIFKLRGLKNKVAWGAGLLVSFAPSSPSSKKTFIHPPLLKSVTHTQSKQKESIQDIPLPRLSPFKNTPVPTLRSTSTTTLTPSQSHRKIEGT